MHKADAAAPDSSGRSAKLFSAKYDNQDMWWAVGAVVYLVLVFIVVRFLRSASLAEARFNELEGISDTAQPRCTSASREDSEEKDRVLQEVG